MKRDQKIANRAMARAMQVTATAVLAMSFKDTMFEEWITVNEYAKFVGVSKTSARASLTLAVQAGLMAVQKTGMKTFFYEPLHPHLKELVKQSRGNPKLQEAIGKLTKLPF